MVATVELLAMPTLKPATHALLLTMLDGIDATTDGRGFGADHAQACQEIDKRLNAYPRLVASLQALAGHEDDFYQTDATIAARALLRSLGEE